MLHMAPSLLTEISSVVCGVGQVPSHWSPWSYPFLFDAYAYFVIDYEGIGTITSEADTVEPLLIGEFLERRVAPSSGCVLCLVQGCLHEGSMLGTIEALHCKYDRGIVEFPMRCV